MGLKDILKRTKLTPLTAKEFCELCPYLTTIQLNGQFNLKGIGRQVYTVDVQKNIPKGYKRSGAFEVIYDSRSHRLYCIVPECGIIRLAINGEFLELNTSDIVSCSSLLAGRVPMVFVENNN